MELTRNEILVAQVAIADTVGQIAKEAKEEARADLAAAAAANGMEKAEHRLEAFGEDCGTVSVKRKQDSIEIRPGQDYSACEYLYQQGLAYPKPVTGWRDRFAVENGCIIDKKTGEDVSRFFEVVDGGYSGRVTVKTLKQLVNDLFDELVTEGGYTVTTCRSCGRLLVSKSRGMKRKYCDNACRQWGNRNHAKQCRHEAEGQPFMHTRRNPLMVTSEAQELLDRMHEMGCR